MFKHIHSEYDDSHFDYYSKFVGFSSQHVNFSSTNENMSNTKHTNRLPIVLVPSNYTFHPPITSTSFGTVVSMRNFQNDTAVNNNGKRQHRQHRQHSPTKRSSIIMIAKHTEKQVHRTTAGHFLVQKRIRSNYAVAWKNTRVPISRIFPGHFGHENTHTHTQEYKREIAEHEHVPSTPYQIPPHITQRRQRWRLCCDCVIHVSALFHPISFRSFGGGHRHIIAIPWHGP